MKDDIKTVNIHGCLVALYPISGLKAVAIDFRLKAGSWYEETKETWGKAHLLEHMMFQGTKTFVNRDAIEEYKEENGIWCNAWTSGSQVELSFRMPAESIDKGLDLAKEMLFDLNISEEALLKQKQVVGQEYEDRISRSGARFWEKIVKQRFGDKHMYARDGIGKPDCFNNLSGIDLLNYQKRFFVPANMFIGVAGNFDSEKVIERLQKLLTANTSSEPLRYVDTTPSFARLIHFEEKMTTATVCVSWSTKGLDSLLFDERLKLGLASYLFGGSSRSLLFKEIRERLGLAYSASSGIDYYPNTGIFEVETSVKKENVDKVILEIKTLLKKFTSSNIDQKVFERAKNYLIMQKEMAYESAMGTASSLSSSLFWHGEIVTPDQYRKAINRISEAEVRKALEDIIKGEKTIETVMMSKE